MRENHYAILALLKNFSGFPIYKISITLLIFPKCPGRDVPVPTANLLIVCGITKDLAKNFIST